MTNTNIPKKVELSSNREQLTLEYPGHPEITLEAEYLRVFSPSAEVRGHGVGNEVLQTGKRGVQIVMIEQIGNYSLKFTYSDGHDSGLYTWDYLKSLCENHEEYWDNYLQKLEAAGESRDRA